MTDFEHLIGKTLTVPANLPVTDGAGIECTHDDEIDVTVTRYLPDWAMVQGTLADGEPVWLPETVAMVCTVQA